MNGDDRLERRLLRRIGALNKAWNLIEPEDHVMVAFSGGKDSWSMLQLLRAYRRVVPFRYSMVVVTLDQGHRGFPADRLRIWLSERGYEHRIERVDTYSVVVENTPPGQAYCSLCSRLRRGILYDVAERIGATKIALGHHRDDVIETLLLNLFWAGQLKAMPPRLCSDDGRNVVIRPLAWCAEADLAGYAAAAGFPVVACDLCGSQEGLRRARVKAWLAELEREHPTLRANVIAAVANVKPSHLWDRRIAARAEDDPMLDPIEPGPELVRLRSEG
jgi:tRNA 2-thiocytidine biosynthesis protein TtcA